MFWEGKGGAMCLSQHQQALLVNEALQPFVIIIIAVAFAHSCVMWPTWSPVPTTTPTAFWTRGRTLNVLDTAHTTHSCVCGSKWCS